MSASISRGLVVGAKRLIGVPSASNRNLVKFHLLRRQRQRDEAAGNGLDSDRAHQPRKPGACQREHRVLSRTLNQHLQRFGEECQMLLHTEKGEMARTREKSWGQETRLVAHDELDVV